MSFCLLLPAHYELIHIPHSPELEVEFWQHNFYHPPGETGLPPAAILFGSIQCQLQRGECHLVSPSLWVMTTLQQVKYPLFTYGEAYR